MNYILKVWQFFREAVVRRKAEKCGNINDSSSLQGYNGGAGGRGFPAIKIYFRENEREREREREREKGEILCP